MQRFWHSNAQTARSMMLPNRWPRKYRRVGGVVRGRLSAPADRTSPMPGRDDRRDRLVQLVERDRVQHFVVVDHARSAAASGRRRELAPAARGCGRSGRRPGRAGARAGRRPAPGPARRRRRRSRAGPEPRTGGSSMPRARPPSVDPARRYSHQSSGAAPVTTGTSTRVPTASRSSSPGVQRFGGQRQVGRDARHPGQGRAADGR